MQRRAALLCLTAGLWQPAGRAAEAITQGRRYAVVSLIGDRLQVVAYAPKVGSRIDTNRHDSIVLPEPLLDKDALRAATRAIASREPSAVIAPMLPSADALADASRGHGDGEPLRFSTALQEAIRQADATHVVVIAPRRAEASLKASHFHLGSGKLEGAGYYIDRTRRLRRSDTGESGVGFLAPFVYLNVLLADGRDFKVIKAQAVEASTTLSAARSETSLDPWDVLTPSQKIETIRRMISREVGAATASVLQSLPSTQ